MRKGWIAGIVALVVVVVVAAGGYYLFFQDKVQAQVEETVRRVFANPPAPYTKATYDKLDVALASHRLTIDDIVLERSTPPYVIKIGRFEATGIDIDALQTVFDPARYKDGASDQTFRKLADTLTLTKIDSDWREGRRTTIDQFAAKGIQGHQFNVKPETATFAAMSERERALIALDAVRVDGFTIDNLNAASQKSPTGKVRRLDVSDFSRAGVGALVVSELDLMDPASKARTSWKKFELRDIPGDPWFDYVITGVPPSDVLRLIALGGVKFEDLRIEPGQEDRPTIRIVNFDLGKLDRKRLSSFSLAGLDVSDGRGGVTIGAIDVKGVNWEQLLGLAGQKDWLAKIGDLSYGIDKFSVRDVGGATMDRIGAKIKEIAFNGFVDRDGGKTESAFTIDSFEIDGKKVNEPEISSVLEMLDYDKVNLSLDTSGVGDFKAGTQSLDKLRLFGPQLGDFNLSFALSDYQLPPPGKKPPSIDDALAPLLAAKLQSLKVSWKDDGLTARVLKAAAAHQGMTAEQLREGLIMQVKSFSELYKGDAQVLAAFQAVIDYLKKPGALVVSVKPPQPPRFGELGMIMGDKSGGPPDLPEIFRVLGVTVTAN
jgi:hypothetical protein